MDAQRFDRISALTTDKPIDNKTVWKIKVRLTRLWKSINSTTGNFKGYNMILLDDDKTHIHAFAGLDFVNGIEVAPEEGKIYIITDFNVDDSKFSYSAVSNKKEIYFLKRTTMTLLEKDDGMIPKYQFELVAFTNLKERVGDIKLLTYLMGLVQNRLPMQSRNTSAGPKDILMFDITDGSEIVKVTVWGDLAKILNDELDKRHSEENIIILTSCGITLFRSMIKQLQASTLSPSKFYINPEYDAVQHLRFRLTALNEPILLDDTYQPPDCSVKEIHVYNLKQITDLRSSKLKILQVICHVSVCSIETQAKWWVYSCDGCPGELLTTDDNYTCKECGKVVSYPDKRFKISLFVNDSSETIQVFLFDREVRRLISTTVNSLIGQHSKEGEPDQLPEKLKKITGKNLKLTISLNDKNLIHGNTVYFASDVVEDFQTSEFSQNSGILKHNVDFVELPHSSNSGDVEGTLQSATQTNKRVRDTENGAKKKNKSKIV